MALVGASGGGKSTVAALLLGLYRPQRGEVLVDDVPLSDLSALARIRMCTAAVLQNPMLLSGSVEEVIAYGRPTASAEEVRAAAAAANADGFVALLPDGYASPVGERGHALSGGQKQRLAIARALLMQPKVRAPVSRSPVLPSVGWAHGTCKPPGHAAGTILTAQIQSTHPAPDPGA